MYLKVGNSYLICGLLKGKKVSQQMCLKVKNTTLKHILAILRQHFSRGLLLEGRNYTFSLWEIKSVFMQNYFFLLPSNMAAVETLYCGLVFKFGNRKKQNASNG